MFWPYIGWIQSWFYKPRYHSSFWYFAEKYRLKFLVLPAIFLLYWLFLEIRIRKFKRIRNELLLLQRDTERRLDFYRKDIFLRYSQFQDLTLTEYDDEESDHSIDKEHDSQPWCMCASSVQFSADEHRSASEFKAMGREATPTKGVYWKKRGDPDGDTGQKSNVSKHAKRTRSASESDKDLLEEPPFSERDKPKERRKSAPGRYKVIKRTTTETWSEERITRRPIFIPYDVEADIRRKRTSPVRQEESSRRRTDRFGEKEGAIYRSKSDYGSGKELTDVEDYPDDEDRNTDESESYRAKAHKDERDISTEQKKKANRYEKGKNLRDERDIATEEKKKAIRYEKGRESSDERNIPIEEKKTNRYEKGRELSNERDIPTEEKKKAMRYEKGRELSDERIPVEEKKKSNRYEKGNEERDISNEEKKRTNRYEKGKELSDERDIPIEDKKKTNRFEKGMDLNIERDISIEEKKKPNRYEKGKELRDESDVTTEEKKKPIRYEKGKDLRDERDIATEEKKKAIRYEKGRELSAERNIPTEEKKKTNRYEKGRDLSAESDISTEEKKKTNRHEKGRDLSVERNIKIEEKKKITRYENGRELSDGRDIPTEEKKRTNRYEKGIELTVEREISIEEKKKPNRYEKGKELSDERDIPTEEKKKTNGYEKGKERDISTEEKKKANRYEKGKELSDERDIPTEEKKTINRYEKGKDLSDDRDIPTEEKKRINRYEKSELRVERDIAIEEKKKTNRYEKGRDLSNEKDIPTEEKKTINQHEKGRDLSDDIEEKKKTNRYEKGRDLSDDISTEEKKKTNRYEKGIELSVDRDISTEEKKKSNRYEKGKELREGRNIEEERRIKVYEESRGHKEEKRGPTEEEKRSDRRRTDYEREKDLREGTEDRKLDRINIDPENEKELRSGKERAPEERTTAEEEERPTDRDKLDQDRRKFPKEDRGTNSEAERMADKETMKDDRKFPLQKRGEVRKDSIPIISPGINREDEDFPRPGTFQEKRKEFINLISSLEEDRKSPDPRTSIKGDQQPRVQEKEIKRKVAFSGKPQIDHRPSDDDDPARRISEMEIEELIRSIDFDGLKEKSADIPPDSEAEETPDSDGEFKRRKVKKDTSCDAEVRTVSNTSQTGCGDPECCGKKATGGCRGLCSNTHKKKKGGHSSRGASSERRTARAVDTHYSRTNTNQRWSKSPANADRSTAHSKPKFSTNIEINITENKDKEKSEHSNHPRQLPTSSGCHRRGASRKRKACIEGKESVRFLKPPPRKDEKDYSRQGESSADIGYILPRENCYYGRRVKVNDDAPERRRRRESSDSDISRNDVRSYPKPSETSVIDSKPSSDVNVRQADSTWGKRKLENKTSSRRRISEPDGGIRQSEDERKRSEPGRKSR